MNGAEFLGSSSCPSISEAIMEPLMTKTFVLAALPLILSLGVIPAAQAQPAHAGWRDAYDSVVVIPHRNAEEYLRMREPRWFAPPHAAAQPQDHVKDPFVDLHFE
jgi:hypothetical protein